MTAARTLPTFRDPAGSLALQDDCALRTIHPGSRSAVLEFIHSPLYRRMCQRGDVIETTVEDHAGVLRLRHPRISVPSYPWEWTPSQWLAAAELTLDLCAEALDDGWILKDATPHNILFTGNRPVLVDVLSFERRNAGSMIWLAYAQYVRTFYLPLLMHRLLSWPLELSHFRRDGYTPDELYPLLGWRHRLSLGAFGYITLPVWLSRHVRKGNAGSAQRSCDPEIALNVLQRRLHGLRKRTRRAAAIRAEASAWSEYAATQSHYTADEVAQKREWVRQVLEETHPVRVLDIGANTGEFSMLAACTGTDVVALERDAVAAERLYRSSIQAKLPVQTIHADLARPTPAAGWEHAESTALLPRLEERFDMVMLLAVMHHLLLMEQIPLPAIIALCHRLTTRYLILEWVPASDPMYREMMRGRDQLYAAISEKDLLRACNGRFQLLRQHTLHNGRILYLFQKEIGV